MEFICGATTFSEALEQMKKEKIDIAIIEIEDISKIEVAKKIKKINPVVNIIFISKTEEFAYAAYEIYASAYLLKPISYEAIKNALANLRFQVKLDNLDKLEVKCFGVFDATYKGTPLEFKRSKTKELLAILVDKQGSICSSDILISYLWRNKSANDSVKNQLRVLIHDLNQSLKNLGLEDVLNRTKDGLGINKEKIVCDYYKYLQGDPISINLYNGEYMVQYNDWSRRTESKLNNKI